MNVHFMSEKIDYGTPDYIFEPLNEKYNFTLDVCANKENAKCEKFYSKEEDGLKQVWQGRCWMNPPYGRAIGEWVKKAHDSIYTAEIIVALLPARTDTKYFHDYIYKKFEIEFLKGRIKFEGGKHSAPFPSMLVFFEKQS